MLVKYKKKHIFIFLIGLLFNNTLIIFLAKGQKYTVSDTVYVISTLNQASSLVKTSPDSTILLAEQTLKLSQKTEFEKGVCLSYYQISCAFRAKKNYTKALYYGQECVKCNEKINNQKSKAAALNNLGIIYEKQHKYDKAIDYYTQAKILHERIGDMGNMAMNINNIANILSAQNKYKEALVYYFKALEIKEKYGNTKNIAGTFTNIGVTYSLYDDYENAIIYYTKALNIYQQNKDEKGIANILNNIGNIYEIQGKYDKSLEYYVELLELVKTFKDKSYTSHTLGSIGNVHKDLGNYLLALEYYQKALDFNIAMNDEETIPINMINMGDVYLRLKKPSKALEYYEKTLYYYEKLNEINDIANVYNRMGSVYMEQGQYEKSLKYYNKSLDINKKQEDRGTLIQSYKGIGKVYAEQKDFKNSLIFFHKALDLANDIKLNTEKYNLYLSLYQISKQQQQYDKALVYYEQAKVIEDSLFDIEKSKKIAILESTLALERKGQELILSEKNNLLRKNEISRQIAARKMLEKQAETSKYLYWIRENKNKNKVDSLFSLTEKSRLEAKILRVTEAKILAEKNIITEENKWQKNMNYAIVSCFLVALMAIYFIYKSWKTQKRDKEEIALQKEEIETQAEQLEILNQTKDRLFAIIAHDLRGPIISFQGVAKQINFFLKKDKIERIYELAETIDIYSNNLNNLLDNLLSWSLIQRRDIRVKPEKLNLKKEVEESLLYFQNILQTNSITLRNEIDEQRIITIDKNIFQTIVRNILSNAVKFTPENGQIRLYHFQETTDTITFCVEDSGVGIAPEKLASLFLFNNTQSSTGLRGEKGIGLGLKLCHELAQLSNAKIQATSQPNKGTTMQILLHT